MKKFLVVLFTLLLLPVVSLAKYVAVLETISDMELLTLQERQYLTDILRGQAVRELPAEQNWTIMTRENINVMLPPGKSIEDCEGSCRVLHQLLRVYHDSRLRQAFAVPEIARML